jgi:hypothetical protein
VTVPAPKIVPQKKSAAKEETPAKTLLPSKMETAAETSEKAKLKNEPASGSQTAT